MPCDRRPWCAWMSLFELFEFAFDIASCFVCQWNVFATPLVCAWTNLFELFEFALEIRSCVLTLLMHRYIHDVEVDVI